MIEESVRKTGRLVVVQEDTENCSVGQMIISHLAARPDVWSRLMSPPSLVSKGNVMIGYNPIYEYTALPDAKRVIEAVRRVMSGTLPPRTAVAGAALRRDLETSAVAGPAQTPGRTPPPGRGEGGNPSQGPRR